MNRAEEAVKGRQDKLISRLRPERTQAALRRLRWRSIQRTLRGRLDVSRWQICTAVVTSSLVWVGLFGVSYWGLDYLAGIQWISDYLIELLFSLFFSTLWIMLIFSTGILLYAGLFNSAQSRAMLTLPLPADLIFAYKFQESLLFSSWGFLILGSPLLVAYGIIVGAAWWYYLLGVPFFLAFCLLSGSLGGLLALLITLLVPRSKRELAVALALALVGLGFYHAVRAWQNIDVQNLTQTALLRFLEHLRISHLPLLPHHWISTGLLALARRRHLYRAMLYLGVLASHALLAYLITAAAHGRWYRRAYDRVSSQSLLKRRSNRAVVSMLLERLFSFLPPDLRALAVKDVKTFLRDPLQFLQLLILTGLLSAYIITLGTMQVYTQTVYLKTMIGLLNLFVMGLFLNAFASRFVFPLLSLEGQRMWVLGLCPVSRDAILWSKFALSASGSCLLLLGLTVLNILMLRLDVVNAAMQLVLVPVLACGLSGLAVGLGARFADLKETDPSRLAAGFGGTLNLLASLAFLVLSVLAMVLPTHFYVVHLLITGAARAGPLAGPLPSLKPQHFGLLYHVPPALWIAAGTATCVCLAVVATWVPMRLGIRAFRAMEL